MTEIWEIIKSTRAQLANHYSQYLKNILSGQVYSIAWIIGIPVNNALASVVISILSNRDLTNKKIFNLSNWSNVWIGLLDYSL